MQFRGVSHGPGVLAVYELDEAVAGAMACLVLLVIVAVLAIVWIAPPPSEVEMMDMARRVQEMSAFQICMPGITTTSQGFFECKSLKRSAKRTARRRAAIQHMRAADQLAIYRATRIL